MYQIRLIFLGVRTGLNPHTGRCGAHLLLPMWIEHNFGEVEPVVRIILTHRNIELCVWMKQDQA